MSNDSPDPTTLALVAAIEKLPVLTEKREQILHFANRLVIFGQFQHYMDALRARETTSDAAQKEIDTFIKRASALREHIAAMHRNSLSRFENLDDGQRQPGKIEGDLAKLIRVARASTSKDDIRSSSPRGRPEMRGPKQIAKSAAKAFAALTGNRPTVGTNPTNNKAYGPFLDFLTDVFDALQIDASAEYLAREAVKEK